MMLNFFTPILEFFISMIACMVIIFGAEILPYVAQKLLPKKISSEWFAFTTQSPDCWDYEKALVFTGIANILNLFIRPLYLIYVSCRKIYSVIRGK